MISAATGGHRRPAAGSTGIRPRAVICGLLLSLPGICGPLADPAAPDRPYAAPPPTTLPAPSPSLLPAGRQEPLAQADAPELIDQMPGLPALDVEYTGQDEDTLAKRVAGRISDRVWSAGKSLLTPSSLLSTATALRDGNISQRGGQALQNLQDQLFNAVIDAGIDELQRGVEGTFIRNLQIRYQTPFAGRSGSFSVDGIFSIADFERQAIFGQAGALFGDDDGGFNLGLGYRHLLPNDQVLLGINFFYDYHKEAELKRISLGTEAKSTALDAYFNWYRMVGSGNRVGGDIEEYTPDGFDFELAGRVPSLPWVELSGRYYHWFLDDGDTERTKYGDSLTGLRYALTLQPMPIIGLELKLDDPEEGGLDWGVSANLKYRFGVPLHEQLRYQRVKAHDPIHRRFERVRRQYRMLVRRRTPVAPGTGTVAAGPSFRWKQSAGYLVSRPGLGQTRIQLQVQGTPLSAGTELNFTLQSSGENAAEYSADYTADFLPDGSGGWQAAADIITTNPQLIQATYTAPRALAVGKFVEFQVMGVPQGMDPLSRGDRTFTVTVTGGGRSSVSTTVTVTDNPLNTTFGFGSGGANRVEVKEPDSGSLEAAIPLALGSDFMPTDAEPLTVRVRVEPGSTTADCRADSQADYLIYENDRASATPRNCPESDVDLSFEYEYEVTTADPSLKFQIQSDDLYKGERRVQLTIESVGADNVQLEMAVATLIIYEADDDQPRLSLVLVTGPDTGDLCTTVDGQRARTATIMETPSSDLQASVSLRVCSDRPIKEHSEFAAEALVVPLMLGGSSTIESSDFAGTPALGGISLKIPIVEGRRHSDDKILRLQADEGTTLQDDETNETLELSITENDNRYKITMGEGTITLTVTDDDGPVIGFAAASEQDRRTLTEEGSAAEFALNSSLAYDGSSMESNVWISLAPASCTSKISLGVLDGMNVLQPLFITADGGSYYWKVPANFSGGDTVGPFNIGITATADTDTQNHACTLEVIANPNQAAVYNPSPTQGTLALIIEDNDQPSINFSSNMGGVTEGANLSPQPSITIGGLNGITCGVLKGISFSYGISDPPPPTGGSLASLSCTDCTPSNLLGALRSDGSRRFSITGCGADNAILRADRTLTLALTVKDDDVSVGQGDPVQRPVSIEFPAPARESAEYSVPDANKRYTLTITEDDMTTFGFGDSTLELTETDADFAQTLNVDIGGSSSTRDLEVPLRIQSVNGSEPGSSTDYVLGSLVGSVFTPAAENCPATLTTGICRDTCPVDVLDCYRIQIRQNESNFPDVAIQVISTEGTDVSEQFTLELQPDSNTESPYTVTSGSGSLAVTIVDDEGVPAVSFANAETTVDEPASGYKDRDIALSITGITAANCPNGTALTLNYSITAGTATGTGADVDYQSVTTMGHNVYTCTGSESNGEASFNLPVSIRGGDGIDYGGDTFTITLSGPAQGTTGYRVGTTGRVTVTITDPESSGTAAKPRVFISRAVARELTVEEGGSVGVTFAVNPAPSNSLTLVLRVTSNTDVNGFGAVSDDLAAPVVGSGGSCNNAADWPSDGQVTVSASQASAGTVTVFLCAKEEDGLEGTEYLTVELRDGTGYESVASVSGENKQRRVKITDPLASKPVVYLEALTATAVGEDANDSARAVTATVKVNASDLTPAVPSVSGVALLLGGNATPDLTLASQASSDDISITDIECGTEQETTSSVSYHRCTVPAIATGNVPPSTKALTFNVVNDEFDEDDETLYVRLEQPAAGATYLIAGTGSTRSLTITDDDVITVGFADLAPTDTNSNAEILILVETQDIAATDGQSKNISYSYYGGKRLAPHVQRSVLLQNGCATGATGDALGLFGFTTNAPLTDANRAALSPAGQMIPDYYLSNTVEDISTRIDFTRNTLDIDALRVATGANIGTSTSDASISVTVRNDTDGEATQYGCLQLVAGADSNVTVDEKNSRYRVDIPSNGLPLVQFGIVAPSASITDNNDGEVASCRTENDGSRTCRIREGDSGNTDAIDIQIMAGAGAALSVGICVTDSGTSGYAISSTNTANPLATSTAVTTCETGSTRHTLEFPASTLDRSAVIRFVPAKDATTDAAPTVDYTIQLQSSENSYTLPTTDAAAMATVTILDDDITAFFTGSTSSVNETENGDITLRLTLSIASSAAETVPVYLSLDNVTELGSTGAYVISVTSPTDIAGEVSVDTEGGFTLQVPITSGSSSVDVVLNVVANDDTDQDNEEFTLGLRGPDIPVQGNNIYYKIGTGTNMNSQHMLTINDDDRPPTLTTTYTAPMAEPLQAESTDATTATVTVGCEDVPVAMCSAQTFNIYLRAQLYAGEANLTGSSDSAENMGFARHYLQDGQGNVIGGGDYRVTISGTGVTPTTVTNVTRTGDYILLGSVVGQTTDREVTVNIDPEGSANGDEIFEGTEQISFKICVGSLNDANSECMGAGAESGDINIKLTDLDQPTLRAWDTDDDATTSYIIDDSSNMNLSDDAPGPYAIDIAARGDPRGALLSTDSKPMILYFTSSITIGNSLGSGELQDPTADDLSRKLRDVSYGKVSGSETDFMVTIMNPGGLNFAQDLQMVITGMCGFLPDSATITWASIPPEASHYKLASPSLSAQCQ